MRCWLPIAIGMLALVAASTAAVSGLVSYALIIAGFALVLDGGTKAFERAGGVGGMSQHRQ